MTVYTATVAVQDGHLTVSRPYPAVQVVDDLVDDLVYRLRENDTGISRAELTLDVEGTAPADPVPDPAPVVDPTPDPVLAPSPEPKSVTR
jgi:hypothetical protein